MEHDSDLSHGFDAGNYASAYETEDFELAMDALDGRSEAYCHAFVLGFFSSFELDEIPSEHQDIYMEAYFSEHGKRVLALGFIDPFDPYVITHDQRTALLGYRVWASKQPLCAEDGYPWTEQLFRDLARKTSKWAGAWELLQALCDNNEINEHWLRGLDSAILTTEA